MCSKIGEFEGIVQYLENYTTHKHQTSISM